MWTPRTDFVDTVMAVDVNESYAATLTNLSGAQRVATDVVVLEPIAANSSFETTVTEADPLVIGVVAETIAAAGTGLVQYGGVCTLRVDAATTRGEWLVTSTTPTMATPKATFQNGVFALALQTSVGAGTIDALLMVGAFPGDDVNLDGTLTILDGNELRFREPSGGGTNYVGFEAPALAANQIWVLPTADASASGRPIISDAAGNLDWGPRSTIGQIVLTAAGGWPSTTNGCAANTLTEYITNDIDMYSLDFDKDADEYAQWTLAMPVDWDAGTMTAIFYWTAAAGAGTVEWNLQGRSYADSDAIDQAWGTAQPILDTLITAADVHITSATPAITLAGTPAAAELVQFRVYRDVSDDTLTADARLLAVKITYARS